MRNKSIISKKQEKLFLGVILSLAFIFYAVFIIRTAFSINDETYFTLIDDAMISMRYARNLANGYGLVWNVGDLPVEGFTNLGWTLFMAAVHKIPIAESKISLLVMISSSILLIGNAYLVYKLSDSIDPDAWFAPIIAATVTAFYYPLVFWSLRGMEVGVISFLVCGLVTILINPSKPIGGKKSLFIGMIVVLAILVRFDVIFQITLILLFILYNNVFNKKTGLFGLSPIFLLFFVGTSAILLFQYKYFGSIMPNTYYLKVEGVSLSERLKVGIQTFVEFASRDFLAPFFVIISGFFIFRDLRQKKYLLLLALFLIQCAYSIYVGGDYAEPLFSTPQVDAANRFIAQGMPFVIILFSIVIDRFIKKLHSSDEKVDIKTRYSFRSSVNISVAISLAILIIISGEPWFKWTVHNAPLLYSDIWRTKRGIQIKDFTDEDALIAVHAAGQISYYSNRRTIDLLGKSDPVVAKKPPVTNFRPGHNKWDYQYSIMVFLPDLIADEWGQLSRFLQDRSEYSRLESGIWYRTDTTLVNVEALSQIH